jgi:PAS domain S-box-containing protein
MDGRIVFANKTAEQILGLSRSQIADRNHDDPGWRITDFEGGPFPMEELPFNRVAETGRPVKDIRLAIVHDDGQMVRISINAAPLFTQEGSFDGVVSAFMDVTKQYENEKRIKRNIEEKEVMLREIHHRVRNNLNVIVSLLNLQEDEISSPEEALQAFTDSKNRIYSIALVHDQLYRSSDFAHIEFKTYIENLVGNIAFSLGMNEKVRLDIRVEEIHVAVDKSIPLAIILNELLSNSYRHAFPGTRKGSITLHLTHKPSKKCVLIYSDDGVGLPEEVDIENPSTVGFQIIQSLVSQLEGKLSVERTVGTTFTLEF